MKQLVRTMGWIACLGATQFIAAASAIEGDPIPFTSEYWELNRAQVFEYDGRQVLTGFAKLKDVQFQDGVIDVDVLAPHVKTYPGIVFRLQSANDYERFYIRPHRSGHYPDALQYTPVFGGIAGWQLYHGDGYTAPIAELPRDDWFHVRIEVKGEQARVFIGDDDGDAGGAGGSADDGDAGGAGGSAKTPALQIHQLGHGISAGQLGLYGPMDQQVCFSNFSYRRDDELIFAPPPPNAPTLDAITQWELSRAYPASRVNRDSYPRFYSIFSAQWESVAAAGNGLVDIARYRKWSRDGTDLVLARKIFYAESAQIAKFRFGYSDDIDLFFNGHKVFGGQSGYQHRDPAFVGAVGYFDTVYLPLRKGLNEIFLMVTEKFGGWGFMGALDAEVTEIPRQHESLEKVWETEAVFLTPESIQYDRINNCIYVSNFDNRYQADATEPSQFTGYISKLNLAGTIIDQHWVENLHAPCGLALRGDRLYTVERRNLVEIDTGTGQVLSRFPIPGADFPNDIDLAANGDIYITDTSPAAHIESRIYRFHNGEVTLWEAGEGVNRANGILCDGDRLLIGNTGDGLLKAFDVPSKRLEALASLGVGVIDGIRRDNSGNILVSHWEGQLYRLSPDGALVEILDTMKDQQNCADFEFVADQDLVVVPTFIGNRVVAYRLK